MPFVLSDCSAFTHWVRFQNPAHPSTGAQGERDFESLNRRF
jgi:hypothetical protein